jgi:hypothetical protein
MGNLPAMNNQQAAKARHQQLVDLINTRLDRIERGMIMK